MESKMPEAMCGDMDDASDSVRGRFRNPQRFSFGPWVISTTRSHIMPSADMERVASELGLPALPEMTFGSNALSLSHSAGFGLEFTARAALARVHATQQHVQVACAAAWRSGRSEGEGCPDVVKPFDWTFTSDYRGTLTGDKLTLQVSPTEERVDVARLRARERILFFDEVLLYEDELHDHGTATLSVKVRVMPSCLFLLQRYFLRVDGVLLRSNETRVYHQAGTDYLLREYSSRENLVSELQHVPTPTLSDPNEICQLLELKQMSRERLQFPTLPKEEVDQVVEEQRVGGGGGASLAAEKEGAAVAEQTGDS